MRRVLLLMLAIVFGGTAWADLNQSIDLNPSKADVRQTFSRCNLSKNTDEKISSCTDVIASGNLGKQELSQAFNNRGVAYGRLGQHMRALEDFEQALRLNKRYAEALHNRAVVFGSLGQFDRAIEDLDRAIRFDPLPGFYRSRGVAYESLGQFKAALKDYEQATELNPTDAASYNSKAWILATAPSSDLRDGRRALSAALKAVDLQDTASYYDTLASAYAENRQFAQAIEQQQRAIQKLREEGISQKIADYESRLRLYEESKPFRLD